MEMIDTSLIKKILDSYSIKRNHAIIVAENNMQKAYEIEEYKNLDKQKRELVFNKGKLEFELKNMSSNDANLPSLQKQIKEIDEKLTFIHGKMLDVLKANNIDETSLVPHFECSKCNDTGFVNNTNCTCLKQAYNNLLMESAGINLDEVPDLAHYDLTIFDKAEQEKVKLVVKKFQDFVKDFDDMKIKNIVLVGGTGVGKTYLSQSLLKDALKNNHTSFFTSAFNLNNQFLKVHTSTSTNKILELNNFVDTELLIIDDLGTEPMLKNVSKEYLLLLLSERVLKNKSTVITSNLLPDEILDKYGERIFSRLFNKSNSVLISMTGKDLRVKK
ncbi:MAG: ATP-binding protein [Clostridiales bacterium]|nr:ATP-binding protein [Candidatus Apopatousia equi]